MSSRTVLLPTADDDDEPVVKALSKLDIVSSIRKELKRPSPVVGLMNRRSAYPRPWVIVDVGDDASTTTNASKRTAISGQTVSSTSAAQATAAAANAAQSAMMQRDPSSPTRRRGSTASPSRQPASPGTVALAPEIELNATIESALDPSTLPAPFSLPLSFILKQSTATAEHIPPPFSIPSVLSGNTHIDVDNGLRSSPRSSRRRIQSADTPAHEADTQMSLYEFRKRRRDVAQTWGGTKSSVATPTPASPATKMSVSLTPRLPQASPVIAPMSAPPVLDTAPRRTSVVPLHRRTSLNTTGNNFVVLVENSGDIDPGAKEVREVLRSARKAPGSAAVVVASTLGSPRALSLGLTSPSEARYASLQSQLGQTPRSLRKQTRLATLQESALSPKLSPKSSTKSSPVLSPELQSLRSPETESRRPLTLDTSAQMMTPPTPSPTNRSGRRVSIQVAPALVSPLQLSTPTNLQPNTLKPALSTPSPKALGANSMSPASSIRDLQSPMTIPSDFYLKLGSPRKFHAAEIAAAAAVLSRPAQTNSFGRFKSVAQEPKSLPLVLTVPAQAAAAAQLSSTFANADVNMISSRRSGRVPKQDTPSVTATSTTTATDPLPATALVQSFNNQSTVNRSSRFAQRAPEQLSAPHRNDLPREAPKVNADLLNAFSAEWASASDEVAKQQRRARRAARKAARNQRPLPSRLPPTPLPAYTAVGELQQQHEQHIKARHFGVPQGSDKPEPGSGFIAARRRVMTMDSTASLPITPRSDESRRFRFGAAETLSSPYEADTVSSNSDSDRGSNATESDQEDEDVNDSPSLSPFSAASVSNLRAAKAATGRALNAAAAKAAKAAAAALIAKREQSGLPLMMLMLQAQQNLPKPPPLGAVRERLYKTITDVEFNDLQSVFSAILTAFGNVRINRRIVKEFLVNEKGFLVPSEFADHMWAVLNCKKISHLDNAQYIALSAALVFGSDEDKIDLLYEFFDMDHDGFVSSHDVFQGLRIGLQHSIIAHDFAILMHLHHHRLYRQRAEREAQHGAMVAQAKAADDARHRVEEAAKRRALLADMGVLEADAEQQLELEDLAHVDTVHEVTALPKITDEANTLSGLPEMPTHRTDPHAPVAQLLSTLPKTPAFIPPIASSEPPLILTRADFHQAFLTARPPVPASTAAERVSADSPSQLVGFLTHVLVTEFAWRIRRDALQMQTTQLIHSGMLSATTTDEAAVHASPLPVATSEQNAMQIMAAAASAAAAAQSAAQATANALAQAAANLAENTLAPLIAPFKMTESFPAWHWSPAPELLVTLEVLEAAEEEAARAATASPPVVELPGLVRSSSQSDCSIGLSRQHSTESRQHSTESLRVELVPHTPKSPPARQSPSPKVAVAVASRGGSMRNRRQSVTQQHNAAAALKLDPNEPIPLARNRKTTIAQLAHSTSLSVQELSFLWRSYGQAARLRFLVTGQPAPLTQPFASLTSGNSIVALSTSHTYKNIDASSNAPTVPPAEAELAFPLLQRPHFTALLVPALRAKLQTLRPGAGLGGRRNSRVLAQRTNNALKSIRAYATTVLESPNASAAAAADGIELSGAQSIYEPVAPTKGHRSGAVRAPLLLLDDLHQLTLDRIRNDSKAMKATAEALSENPLSNASGLLSDYYRQTHAVIQEQRAKFLGTSDAATAMLNAVPNAPPSSNAPPASRRMSRQVSSDAQIAPALIAATAQAQSAAQPGHMPSLASFLGMPNRATRQPSVIFNVPSMAEGDEAAPEVSPLLQKRLSMLRFDAPMLRQPSMASLSSTSRQSSGRSLQKRLSTNAILAEVESNTLTATAFLSAPVADEMVAGEQFMAGRRHNQQSMDKEDIVVDLRLLKGVPIAAKKEKESEPEPPAPLAVAVQPPRRRGHSRAPSIDWTSEAAKTAVGTPTSGPTSANKTTISSMLLGTSHGISLSETQSTANAPAAAAAAASTNVASDWESLFADCIFGSIDQNGVDSIDFEQVSTALTNALRGSLDVRMRFCFDCYDLDHDGVLTTVDLESFVRMPTLRDILCFDLNPLVDCLVQKHLENRRMQISFEEFSELVERQPRITMLLDSVTLLGTVGPAVAPAPIAPSQSIRVHAPAPANDYFQTRQNAKNDMPILASPRLSMRLPSLMMRVESMKEETDSIGDDIGN